MAIAEQHIEWTTPSPLWAHTTDPTSSAARRAFRTPAILRFATDSFMDDFLAQMSQDPARLAEFVAIPETWRSPSPEPAKTLPKSGLVLKLNQLRNAAVRKLEARQGLLPAPPGTPADKPLKLFQPAHQRFYLVTAHLVCRIVGLPDRKVDTSKQEQVSFVIRMLQARANAAAVNPDPMDCDELALVGNEWQVVTSPTLLLEGETQHALSPVTYNELDGRQRRVWAGLVPVGKRETLVGAVRPTTLPNTAAPLSATQMLLKTQVMGPWANLEIVGKTAFYNINQPVFDSKYAPSTADMNKAIQSGTDQIIASSWYVFLDFANFIQDRVPPVWQAIATGSPAQPLSSAEQLLFTKLSASGAGGVTLAQAMKNAKANENTLETVTGRYYKGAPDWPSPALIFPLAQVSIDGKNPLTPSLLRTDLEPIVVAALQPDPPNQPVRALAQASSLPQGTSWFTIRCVFERPNCGTLRPPLLSDPTASFTLASFFDADAPARPIRIGMPVDTTPAGLRKFDNNTAFVLSDVLCGQANQMGGMSFLDLVLSVLPFPFNKGLDSSQAKPCSGGFGLVCSLSIPIITLCAFFLLVIFINLLNIVFFWLPFFRICLPVPKFSAKGGS
jgi:hypothetical protein